MTKAIENQTAEIAPEIAIEQLNLSYHMEQDRLLLRVGLNTKCELMVWLTRRITDQLVAMLRAESGLPQFDSGNQLPGDAVRQFKQEAEIAGKLQQLDFSTQYQHTQKPGQAQTLLATTVSLLDESPKCLEILCSGGVCVRMKLTEELMLALINMLMLTVKEADWQLAQLKSSGEIASVVKPALLH